MKSICLWAFFSSLLLVLLNRTWNPNYMGLLSGWNSWIYVEPSGEEEKGANGSSREKGTHTHTHTQLTFARPGGRLSAVSRCSRFSLHSVSRERRPLEENVRYLFTNILHCLNLWTLSAELSCSHFHHNWQSGKAASLSCTWWMSRAPCNLRLGFHMQLSVAKTQISVTLFILSFKMCTCCPSLLRLSGLIVLGLILTNYDSLESYERRKHCIWFLIFWLSVNVRYQMRNNIDDFLLICFGSSRCCFYKHSEHQA